MMQGIPTVRRIVTLSTALSLSTAWLLFGSMGCTKSPDANAPSETSESITDEQTPTPSTTPAKSARRVNTGADIANEPLLATAGTTILEFDINGMTCAGCAGTITTAATEVEGVEKIRISLVNNKAWVMVTNEQSKATAAEAIKAAVQAAGDYDATLAKSEETADPADEPSKSDG